LLNFTRQERLVIYFLIVSLGIGAILLLIQDRKLTEQLKPDRFYKEEQTFKKISQEINNGELSQRDTLAQSSSLARAVSTEQERINLNTASLEELTELPGIGPAIAGRIKAFTDLHGSFKNIKDVTLVKGIGEKLYTRIQGLVTVE